MFIVLHVTDGVDQMLGAAMSPVVGGAFALSPKWKKQSNLFHLCIISISFLSVIIFIYLTNLNFKKSNE